MVQFAPKSSRIGQSRKQAGLDDRIAEEMSDRITEAANGSPEGRSVSNVRQFKDRKPAIT